MLSPRGKKELKINQRRILINSIEIGIPAPEQVFILGQRHTSNGKIVGRVRNSKTLNYKSFTPHRDGLFCERIFGPVQSYICACGKQGPLTTSKGTLKFCPRCEVEYTDQRARRYRIGYIGLVSPVTHIWHLKGRPSYLSLFLGKRKKTLARLAYCNDYLVEQAFSKVAGNGALSSAKQHGAELSPRYPEVTAPYTRSRLEFAGSGLESDGATFFKNRIYKQLKESKTIKGFTLSRQQKKSKVGSPEAGFINGTYASPSIFSVPRAHTSEVRGCLPECNSGKQPRTGTTFRVQKIKEFDKENQKCTSFLKSLRQLGALQNRARSSSSPKRSTLVLPSSSAQRKLEVYEPSKGVYEKTFREQRNTLSYTRSHTLPFLPTFICEFHLRDGLLSFFDTFPPSEDTPIPVYCKVPRRYPLRDVHKFMADQAFSKVPLLAPSITRVESAKLPLRLTPEGGNRNSLLSEAEQPATSSIKNFDSQNTILTDQNQLRLAPSALTFAKQKCAADLLLRSVDLEPEVRNSEPEVRESATDNNWETKNKSSLSRANFNYKGRVVADSDQLSLDRREVGLRNRKDVSQTSIGIINDKKLLSPFVTRASRKVEFAELSAYRQKFLRTGKSSAEPKTPPLRGVTGVYGTPCSAKLSSRQSFEPKVQDSFSNSPSYSNSQTRAELEFSASKKASKSKKASTRRKLLNTRNLVPGIEVTRESFRTDALRSRASRHSSVTVLREVLLSLLLSRVVTTLVGLTPSLATCLNRPESNIAKSKVLLGAKPTVVMARQAGSQLTVPERANSSGARMYGNFHRVLALLLASNSQTRAELEFSSSKKAYTRAELELEASTGVPGTSFRVRKFCRFRVMKLLAKVRRTRAPRSRGSLESELRLALCSRTPDRVLLKGVPTRYFATQRNKVSTTISETRVRPATQKVERNSLALLSNRRRHFRRVLVFLPLLAENSSSARVLGELEGGLEGGLEQGQTSASLPGTKFRVKKLLAKVWPTRDRHVVPTNGESSRVSTKTKNCDSKAQIVSKDFQLKYASGSWLPVIGESPAHLTIRLVFTDGWSNLGSLNQASLANPYRSLSGTFFPGSSSQRTLFRSSEARPNRKYRLATDASTASQDGNAHLFGNRKDVRSLAPKADNLSDRSGEPSHPSRLEKPSNHRYFEDPFFSLRAWVLQRRTLTPLFGEPEPANSSGARVHGALLPSGKVSLRYPEPSKWAAASGLESDGLLGFGESIEDWLEYWFDRWLQNRSRVKRVLSCAEQAFTLNVHFKYDRATRGSCSALQSTEFVAQTLLSKVKSYDRSEVLAKPKTLKRLSLLSKAEQRPTVFDRFIGGLHPALDVSGPSKSFGNRTVVVGSPSKASQIQKEEQVLFKQSNPVLSSKGVTRASLKLQLCTIKGPLLLLTLRTSVLGLKGQPGKKTCFFSDYQLTSSVEARPCLDPSGPNTGPTSLEIQLLLPVTPRRGVWDSDQKTFSLKQFTSQLAGSETRSKLYKGHTLQSKVTRSNEDKIRSVGPEHNIACYLFKHEQTVNWIKRGIFYSTREQDREINCPDLNTQLTDSETNFLPILPVSLVNSTVVGRGRGSYLAEIGKTTFQSPCSALGETPKVSSTSEKGTQTSGSTTIAKLELECTGFGSKGSGKSSARKLSASALARLLARQRRERARRRAIPTFGHVLSFNSLSPLASKKASKEALLAKGAREQGQPSASHSLKDALQPSWSKKGVTSIFDLDAQVWLPKKVTIFKILLPKRAPIAACSARRPVGQSKQLNPITRFRLGMLSQKCSKKGRKESQNQSPNNKKLIFTASRNEKDYITGSTISSESKSQTSQSVEKARYVDNLNFLTKQRNRVRESRENSTSLTNLRFLLSGSSWARRALERYRDTDLGASLTRVQHLTESAPSNRNLVPGLEGRIGTMFQRSAFGQALLELPNQTPDGPSQPDSLFFSNEDEYGDEEGLVLDRNFVPASIDGGNSSEARVSESNRKLGLSLRYPEPNKPAVESELESSRSNSSVPRVTRHIFQTDSDSNSTLASKQLSKEQLRRAELSDTSSDTPAKFEFTGKVGTDSYIKAQLDLQAIQEVLSYTGGGALRELLRCFDTQAFSVILLHEIKLLREYHKGYFLYEYHQISPKARTRGKLEFSPLLFSGSEQANSNSRYANSSEARGRVGPLKAERDFVNTPWSSKGKEIEIGNKPLFGSNFRYTPEGGNRNSVAAIFRSKSVTASTLKVTSTRFRQAENDNNYEELPEEINRLSRAIHRNARRLKIVQLLMRNKRRPEWMLISALPVLPPDLRPILQMSENLIVASDLNTLYQRVIYRNNRQYKLRIVEWSYATSLQRLVQDAVDRLIENGKGGSKPFLTPGGRPLKSLSDTLKGKKGRFRLNLLGKRVDFSGRSVIVVSPHLKIHECGLPREMALELYQYLLIRKMLLKRQVSSVILAKRVIRQQKPFVWDTLRELIYHHPLLLNRAPTLHRLGIQAFQPKLVLGSTILLHPLVCAGFNADFDGDQMGVHLPLCDEARAEAWDLLWSRNNLLSPATGEPILLPSQDMVLGFYHMTALLPSRHKNSNTQTVGSSHFRKAIESFAGSGLASESQKVRRSYGFVSLAACSAELSKRNRVKGKEEKELWKSYFFSPLDVVRAYQNGDLDVHTPIWLQWKGKIENNDSNQTPLELRINSFGVSTHLYPSYKYRKDASYKSNATFNLFIRTTPGRVIVNNMFLSCSD